jgi:hypothetical protein
MLDTIEMTLVHLAMEGQFALPPTRSFEYFCDAVVQPQADHHTASFSAARRRSAPDRLARAGDDFTVVSSEKTSSTSRPRISQIRKAVFRLGTTCPFLIRLKWLGSISHQFAKSFPRTSRSKRTRCNRFRITFNGSPPMARRDPEQDPISAKVRERLDA